jgi:hypothetical protein
MDRNDPRATHPIGDTRKCDQPQIRTLIALCKRIGCTPNQSRTYVAAYRWPSSTILKGRGQGTRVTSRVAGGLARAENASCFLAIADVNAVDSSHALPLTVP